MRFSDLLPGGGRKQVGRIVSAEWDEAEKGVRFAIRFEPSGRKVTGVCHSGSDPTTGSFVAERDLKAKISEFLNLKVYENASGGDPNTMSAEDFRKLKIELNLSDLRVSYRAPERVMDTNTFLSRMFR
jgi:hypothetical protein